MRPRKVHFQAKTDLYVNQLFIVGTLQGTETLILFLFCLRKYEKTTFKSKNTLAELQKF